MTRLSSECCSPQVRDGPAVAGSSDGATATPRGVVDHNADTFRKLAIGSLVEDFPSGRRVAALAMSLPAA